MKEQIKPGFFGVNVAADVRRVEFDAKNQQYLHLGKKADVVFFGDSITQLWETDLYFNPDCVKINRGINGDTTVYAAKRFDADVIQIEPESVIILLGINDLLLTAPDLWNKIPGADAEEIVLRIETNFREMLSKCARKNIKAYVCSVLPQSLCEPFDRKHFAAYILKINEILKALCAEYSAEYVDYYSAVAENDLLPERFTPDGVHPNAECYDIMAEILKEKVELL